MKENKVEASKEASTLALGWRLPVALVLFGVAIACPIVGTAILAGDFSGKVKAFAGFLFFPIPEVFDLTAIAVLGKPGFEWLKGKLFGFLGRFAPPDQVSQTRYTVGLVMFTLPLFFGWVQPYIIGYVPVFSNLRPIYHIAGDVLFLASFFVLGGDFWDKVRSLFVREARVVFPGPAGSQK